MDTSKIVDGCLSVCQMQLQRGRHRQMVRILDLIKYRPNRVGILGSSSTVLRIHTLHITGVFCSSTGNHSQLARHHHRRNTMGASSSFCIGLGIADRQVMFVIPTKHICFSLGTFAANHQEALSIYHSCHSRQSVLLVGKPSWITTPDYVLYQEFVKRFRQHSITMLRRAESRIMLGRPNGDIDPVTLSADSIATTMDHNPRDSLILVGKDLPPTFEENFRPSKTRSGASRSTVEREAT